MDLKDYKVGQKVEVFINNVKTTNLAAPNEWREGTVIRHQIVYPYGGSTHNHRPYVMLIVEYVRTYFRTDFGFFEKITHGGFHYHSEVRPI